MLFKKEKKKGDRHYYLVYVWHTFLKFPTITGSISALLVVENVEMLVDTGHWCELVFRIIHCYLLLFITFVLQFLGARVTDQYPIELGTRPALENKTVPATLG